jgi:hypothetical protein
LASPVLALVLFSKYFQAIFAMAISFSVRAPRRARPVLRAGVLGTGSAADPEPVVNRSSKAPSAAAAEILQRRTGGMIQYILTAMPFWR